MGTPTEDELLKMLEAGDLGRAMTWLLFLPRTTGVAIVTTELRSDLLALHIEILRLYRVEKRYNKLMEETNEFRKANRRKKIDGKSQRE